MPYVTTDQANDLLSRPLEGSADEIAADIRAAQRDIDNYVGPFAEQADETKFGDMTDPAYPNPHTLTLGQLRRLRDATAYQAQYRQQMGPDFFIEDQRASERGPEVTLEGRVGTIGPLARRELNGSGLLKLTGRMR